MTSLELQKIATAMQVAKLPQKQAQILAYQLLQAFPKASAKYGRQKFLRDCGSHPTSKEAA